MYSLTVRDHFRIAHSFQGANFGPAQRLHGATYVVDVSFHQHQLDDENLVIDIGLASKVLSDLLQEFNLSNLDDVPEFVGKNTTMEFMAKVVFDRLAAAIQD